MDEANLNSMQDIKKLQQKVKDYKDTLTTLKNGYPTDELNHLQEKFNATEKLIEGMRESQNSTFEKHENDISTLAEQLGALNQTIFALTEKISSIIETAHHNESALEVKEESITTKSHSSTSDFPSFKKLQKLLTEPYLIESNHSELKQAGIEQKIENNKKTIQINRFSNTSPAIPSFKTVQKGTHHLNKPTTQRKFSVKLNSTNIPPLSNSFSEHENFESLTNVTKDLESPNIPPAENVNTTVSTTEPLIEKTPEEAEIETSPTAKEGMSLLNFFRKK